MMMGVTTMPRNDNREALDTLFQRLCDEFGEASGRSIIRTIIAELGGLRVTIPSQKTLYIEQRNELIRQKFNGSNYKELGAFFDLSRMHIRRIVHGDS
jgi:Mor family transcriptional regulator